MWDRLNVPYIAERFIGMSCFLNTDIVAISYEGIHKVIIDDDIQIENYHEYPEGGKLYNWEKSELLFENRQLSIMGLHGKGIPQLVSPQGERLELNQTEDYFRIYEDNKEKYFQKFQDMSGDWRAITFDPAGNLIALALPYELQIYRRQENA